MVVRHAVAAFRCPVVGCVAPFSAVTIDTAPDEQVDVEITLAKDGISFDLTIVAHAHFRLNAIHIGTLLGDDVHHPCQGHVAIERRGRSAQHFYLLHLL